MAKCLLIHSWRKIHCHTYSEKWQCSDCHLLKMRSRENVKGGLFNNKLVPGNWSSWKYSDNHC